MNDFYKKANFYYIFIPLLAAIWALIAWAVLLPNAEKKWDKKQKEYTKASTHITKILALDPERLEYEKQKDQSKEFDYASTIEQFAKRLGISSSNYSLLAGREIKRRGQKTKTANITINSIRIEKLARFLSSLLLRWPGLRCEQLKLTSRKEGPDDWKVDMRFIYYY